MATVTLKNFIIAPTELEASVIIDTAQGVFDQSLGGFRQLPGPFELIGVLTTEEILVQIPTGETYGTGADEDSDEWQQYYYHDEAVKLTATNHSETNVAPSVFRVYKPAIRWQRCRGQAGMITSFFSPPFTGRAAPQFVSPHRPEQITSPPAKVSIVSPANGAVNQQLDIYLSWAKPSMARRYDVLRLGPPGPLHW